MGTLKRLEALENHPVTARVAHAQHLLEMLVKGELNIRECTDDELEAISELFDEEEVRRIDAELRQLSEEELQALIDSEG